MQEFDEESFRELYELDDIERPKLPDTGKAERMLADLERAVSSAVKESGYSEDEEFKDAASNIEGELSWVTDFFYELIEYASNADDCLDEKDSEIDGLLRSLLYRLDDDEKEEYTVIRVKNRLKNANG